MNKYFVEKYNASDDEFKITEIKFKSGDKVKKGELIFSIESSKADIDIESQEDGYIYFNLELDQNIVVGELFFIISKDNNIDYSTISFSKSDPAIDISQIGLIISNKAKTLLIQNNISPESLNKKIIKESDVIKYIQYLKNQTEPSFTKDLINFDNINLKKSIVIIGAKGGAKMCIDALTNSIDYEVIGLLDDNINVGETVLGIPIIGNLKSVESLVKLGIKNYVLAFGILENRKHRYDIFKKLSEIGCEFPNVIHPKAIVEKSVILGKGNVILAGSNVGSCVNIGDLNYINNNALISHDCTLLNNIHIAPGAVLASSIFIESHVLVGMNTTIYYGLNIGESSTILNGLVINSNISKNKIQKENC